MPSSLPSTERFVLDNGLTVLLKELHGSPVVGLQAWVNVGSADEPDEIAGISHVFEHMLFKGTARRGVGAIAREVESAGGEVNAWTSFDQTVYHLVLGSRFFAEGLDILTDALRNSSFDKDELASELKVVLEEIKQGEDNPGRVATQSLFGAAFSRHTYRRPVIGHADVVARFRRKNLLEVFHRYYVPNNITLVVVGDFDPTSARALIDKAWKGARRRELPVRRRPVEPPQRSTRVVLGGGEVSEVHLLGGFHIPGMRHPDTAALDLCAILLGQGDSSRLQTDLKRGRQLCTEAWAYSFTPLDPGLLVVGATTAPDRLAALPEALFGHALRLAREEVSRDEVEKARAIVESDAVYQKETVQGMARKLGFFETVTGALSYEDEYLSRARQVTPASLRETVARHVRADNLTLSVMLPARSEILASARARKGFERELRAQVEKAAAAPPRSRAASARVPAASKAQRDGRGEVVSQVLPSGLRLLVLRDPSVEVVAMRAVWLGGLRGETPADNGINNLIAGLCTRGTAQRSGDQIAHEMESLAGSIGGFAGRNSFGLRAEVMSRHFVHGLGVLAECINEPAFAEDELARERRQALEELRTQEDNVSAVAFRMFGRALWPEHPYRMDMLGTPESLAALTREQLTAYHRAHYPASRMVLAVVGDVEPGEVIEEVSRLLPGAGPAGPGGPPAALLPALATAPAPAQPIRLRRQLQKQQAHLVVGFPGITLSHPDRFALEVLTTVLSGQGGRLFVELREKRGLAYRVSAFTLEGIDPGYVAVYVACSPDKLAVAEERIHVELTRIVERKVPAAELSRAQRYLCGSHDISLQRRSALASTLSFNECYGLGWDQYRRYGASILAVTAADVTRVARRLLDRRHSITAIVSPDAELGPARLPTPDEIAKAARA